MSAPAFTAKAPAGTRTWRVPTLPLQNWLFITVCGWGTMLLAVVLVGNVIDHWAWIVSLFGRSVDDISVTGSIWGPISGVAVWFVGFVAGYYLHYYLPAFVANGRVRRDSAIEAAIFSGVLAGVAAVLITVGFVYERVVYAIAGWQRGTPSDMVYGHYNDYGPILLATLSGTLMWAAGGAMIGSSFYRSNERGFVAVVIALAAMSLVSGGNGLAGPSIFIARQLDIPHSLLMTVVLSIVATVALAAITWWNVRTLPLRNK
jgi:hypothetical protein